MKWRDSMSDREIRDLIRDNASQQNRFMDKLEISLSKQTDILQQVGNAIQVVNHNSTATLEAISKISEFTQKQQQFLSKICDSQFRTEKQYVSIIKQVITYGGTVILTLVGAKAIGVL